MGLSEFRVILQREFEELLRLIELPRVAMDLPQFIRGVAVPRIKLQLLLKFLRCIHRGLRRIGLPGLFQQGATQPVVNTGTAGIMRQHLAIFADRGIVGALALIGLGAV